MSILDKALDVFGYAKKTISTSDPIIAQFLSGTDSQQVNKPYANIPPVYKAVKALIDNIAQVNLITVDKQEQPKEDQQINKLLNNIYDDNGQKLNLNDFIQKIAGYYSLYGEVFLQKQAETFGQLQGTQLPTGLIVLDPKNIIAQQNELRQIISWVYFGVVIEPQKIIHIKDFNPYDANRGLSPVKVIMDELKIENSTSAYQLSILENGGVPSLLLETEGVLTPDQQRTIRTAWESRHRGSKNAGKIAVLQGGLKAKAVNQTLNEMQFVDTLKLVEEKIIGTWRVPKAMFGYTDNLNYATFQGQLKVFWEMTLIPLLNKIQIGLNYSLFNVSDTKIKFDLSGVKALSNNLSELAGTIQTLTASGFTRNEINDKLKLGFEDVEWGDSWWIPFSLQPAGTVAQATDQSKEVKKKSFNDKIVAENGLEYTPKAYAFIKNFNNLHDKLHVKFRSALRAYFNGQRKRILDAIDNTAAIPKSFSKAVNINLNWNDEADLYESKMKPNYINAIEQGVKVGTETTGLSPSDRLSYVTNSATKSRLDKIKLEITETTKDKINSEIEEGLAAGEGVEEIKNRVRQYFNKIDNRSEVIARTEITSQLNAGLLLQYDDVGVKQKEWVTTIDQYTRDSHAEINGEIVNVGDSFSLGLMYPGDDGAPEETINCRCSCIPV
jgi:HK97 family phage portal protein